MNAIGYFEIQAIDIERTINFYHTIFGWEFIQESLVPIEYYRIKTGNINGGLLKRPMNTPPSGYGTNAFVCSILVENFDEASKKILQLGGTVALPKFAIAGRCWQGYFVDLEQNIFGIFEIDLSAK